MNILFILGNGFDINLGLKTRYQDFYNVYSQNHSKHDSVMKLKEHISKHTDGYWSDLELALGEYTKEFKSVEDFDEVIDDIVLSLSEYLENIQSLFSKFNINKEKFLADLTYPEKYLIPTQREEFTKFRDDFLNNIWSIDIATFNYTNTTEQIIGNLDSTEIGHHVGTNNTTKIQNILNKTIEHVHGFVDNRMVLGVNDLSQVANTTLHDDLDIQESIIKAKCNEANGEKSNINLSEKIRNADLICAFGLSFGDSDKIWWEEIGEKLRNSSSRMIIFDKNTQINQTLSHKSNRLRRKARNHFLNQTGLPEDVKNFISNRVYVGINTDMFRGVALKHIVINSIKSKNYKISI